MATLDAHISGGHGHSCWRRGGRLCLRRGGALPMALRGTVGVQCLRGGGVASAAAQRGSGGSWGTARSAQRICVCHALETAPGGHVT